MPYCKTCNEFIFTDSHKCPPAWETNVDESDDEDDWLVTYARTAELAAIKRAEEYDVGDYDLLQGGEITIHVKARDIEHKPKILTYTCTGESVPEYRATLIP